MQEQQQPAPFLYCVHGAYTVGYDASVGYFPRKWSADDNDWRAVMQVGYFEIIVLAFPTYQEALAWVYQQP